MGLFSRGHCREWPSRIADWAEKVERIVKPAEMTEINKAERDFFWIARSWEDPRYGKRSLSLSVAYLVINPGDSRSRFGVIVS